MIIFDKYNKQGLLNPSIINYIIIIFFNANIIKVLNIKFKLDNLYK